MGRYGYDHGFRRDQSQGQGWFNSRDEEFGRWGGGAGWRNYPEGGGWSRPEFNTSLGEPSGRYPSGEEGYGGGRGFSQDQWSGYSLPQGGRGRPGEWRAGEPWGGASPADEVRARDLMTENPEAVTPDTALADVARRMRDLDVGIIPVVDSLDGYLLRGVITDRDITVRAVADGRDMKSATVAEFMSRDVETVREGDSVRDVFTVMKREQVRRVPVTDFSGRLVGIIAQADLAVDYAGLDLEREGEVEEVLERISEPARPRFHAGGWRDQESSDHGFFNRAFGGYDRDLRGRLQQGWRAVRRGAREIFDRGYDRGYDRGWR